MTNQPRPKRHPPRNATAVEIAAELLEVAQRYSGVIDLEARESELRDSVGELKKQQDHITSEALRARREKLALVNKEITDTETRLYDAVSDYKRKAGVLDKDYSTKRNELESEFTNQQGAAKRKVAAMVSELESKRGELDSLNGRIAAIGSEVAEAQSLREKLKSENETLKRDQSGMKAEVLELRHSKESTQADVDRLNQERVAAEEETAEANIAARTERKALTAEMEQLRKSAESERRNFRVERTRLHTELEGLRKEHERLSAISEKEAEEVRVGKMELKAGWKALREEKQDFENEKKRPRFNVA